MLPEVTGTGRSGNSWRKQEFILETKGQYPRKVCMSLWGDKIDQFPLQTGSEITASIEVESREYNGRWYTDIRAWKVAAAGVGGPGYAPASIITHEHGRWSTGSFVTIRAGLFGAGRRRYALLILFWPHSDPALPARRRRCLPMNYRLC